jgi:Immunity protein 51
MTPLRIVETTPGSFSLLLNAGDTKVDELVEELGHIPNGYFWRGVALFLVRTDAPLLAGRFGYDPEAGMFAAYGGDRAALEQLCTLMAAVANDGERLRGLFAAARATGFEFDR